MGDTGSNLLGYLLGAIAVQGALKTNAVVALFFPLVVLAVPIFDTGFVIAKRIKYRRPIYRADRWHLHHRMADIGFSQRRTLAYIYGWALVMAGLALALRFIPYSDDHGTFDPVWTAVIVGCMLLAAAASVYLVITLEILKLRRKRSRDLAEPAGPPSPTPRSTRASPASWKRAASRSSTPRPGSGRRSTPRPGSSTRSRSPSSGCHKVVTSARRGGLVPDIVASPPCRRPAGARRLFLPWDRSDSRPSLSGRSFSFSDDTGPSDEGGRRHGRPLGGWGDDRRGGGRVRARLAGRPCDPVRPRRPVRGSRRRPCSCLRSL